MNSEQGFNEMNINQKLNNFKDQIERDIKDIQEEYANIDSRIRDVDYAFLYWILLKLFNIDEEETITDYITEGNDKSVDCFVCFEETKELFIIQCKHYDENTSVIRNDVSDFLKSPLSFLNENKYKKSPTLQKFFNKAKDDPDYKIYLHFYTTNTKYSTDISTLIKSFNIEQQESNKNILAEFFDLNDLYTKYYGESYKKTTNLTFNLKTINKGTFSSLQEEYGIEYTYQAYYIITPVEQIYQLLKVSKDKGYQLFEENIREFLGTGGQVNSAIATTLKSDERLNFLYYNNGITMIVKKAARGKAKSNEREIILTNPQIVNGCQTVNTIYSVLEYMSDKDRLEKYKDVFVMTKVLVIPEDSDTDRQFYHDVVKYTNKQNPIPDKVFAASKEPVFVRFQSEIKHYGFWLKVKQSDKLKFDNFTPREKAEMLEKAQAIASKLNYSISNKDLCIDLEKLLQVALAYILDGYYAFSKKSSVLKTNTEIFKKYSINLQDYLSFENMVRLYLLYKKAEKDKKQSADKRTPIPYYILGFLSSHIADKTDYSCYNGLLDKIFTANSQSLDKVYEYLKHVCGIYQSDYGKDYNVMIKQKISKDILDKAKNTAQRFMPDTYTLITEL